MLDLRRLRYFRAIARCGSMAAASRELNMAQPALSHHMAALEQHLGFLIFERLPRGVRITGRGRILLAHANAILDAVALAENEMKTLAKPDAVRIVRLGLLPSWSASLTPAIIAATSAHVPGTSLHILELQHDEALRRLEQRTVDLALVLTRPVHGPDEPVVEEELMLVAPSDQGAEIAFERAVRSDLILPSKAIRLRGTIESAAVAAGVQINIRMEIDGQESIKQAVVAGVASSIMPWNSIRNEVQTGKLFASRIVAPPLQRSVYLEMARGFDQTLARNFLLLLRQASEARTGDD